MYKYCLYTKYSVEYVQGVQCTGKKTNNKIGTKGLVYLVYKYCSYTAYSLGDLLTLTVDV